MNELEALMLLNHLSLIGTVKIRLLLQLYGSAQKALQVPLDELRNLPGFGPKILEAWQKGIQESNWQKEMQRAKQEGVQLISFKDPCYPKRLLEIGDFPLILYAKGIVKPDKGRCIAVIGTRKATRYGIERAHFLSLQLASANWTIVSGLAHGIDTAAHQGALEKGQTWAVLGSGLAAVYPKENEKLAEAISQQGAVWSEFPLLTPPNRSNFPRRNRIVSGLSVATVVIEAPQKSGAMLTAELAVAQKRLVFALPGRVDQENFRGNHQLIKQKKAQLIENTEDILEVIDPQSFRFDSPSFNFPSAFPPFLDLEKEEKELLKKLPLGEELSIEDIVHYLQWPITKLNVLLMSLVLKKVIKEYPGKIYKKVYRDQ